MAGVYSHGRDDRIDFPFKILFQPDMLFFRQLRRFDKPQPFPAQAVPDIIEIGVLLAHLFMDHRFNGRKLFLRRHAGDIMVRHAAFDEMLDTSYADHKEFIEIGSTDSYKIKLFKKRVGWYHRFAQHPFIEFNPCAFPVQIVLGV